MNKLLGIAVLFVSLIACSGSGNTVPDMADTISHVNVGRENTRINDPGPIKQVNEMCFDSLMTVHGYDFVCELPTGGAKSYMDSTFCVEKLDEVMWIDLSRVVFADLGPMMFSEWKNREVVPVERSDRKVYVDSFIDTEGVMRFDRCDVAYRRNVTRIYYLNVREANRHKMDSLFDRIVFTTGVRPPHSGSIRVGGRVVCDQ